MKLKRGWVKFSLLTLFALSICYTVQDVVTRNLINNVYPIEADSISIPILSTYLSFLALLPFALILSSVTLSKYDEPNKKSKLWFAIKIFFYLISYLVLSFSALIGIFYWNSPYPNHNIISACYVALMILIQSISVFDLYRIYAGYKAAK